MPKAKTKLKKGINSLNTDNTNATNQLTPEQTIQALTALRIRIDACNAQLIQLGLLTEYLYEKLDEQGVSIDMDPFATWAEQRYEEIQKEAEEVATSTDENIVKLREEINEALNHTEVNPQVDLTE